MTQQDASVPTTHAPGWIKIALGLSLAMNLAFAGLIVGSAWRHKGDDSRPAGAAIAGYAQPYIQALPRQDRRQMFRAMRSGTSEGLPDRSARRANFASVLNALRQEPFDRAAVQIALEGQAKVIDRFQSAAQTAWLAQVTEMSAQARNDYISTLEDLLERGPQKRNKTRP